MGMYRALSRMRNAGRKARLESFRSLSQRPNLLRWLPSIGRCGERPRKKKAVQYLSRYLKISVQRKQLAASL